LMWTARCQHSKLLDSDSNEKKTSSSLSEQDAVNQHQDLKKNSRICRSITPNHGLGEAVIRQS
jgi:gamma-glutamylcysteine synthetase